MIAFRKLFTAVAPLKTGRVSFGFAGDRWKDRDEASEKVYITNAESIYAINGRGHHEKALEKS